jgi:hypothetical protein
MLLGWIRDVQCILVLHTFVAEQCEIYTIYTYKFYLARNEEFQIS